MRRYKGVPHSLVNNLSRYTEKEIRIEDFRGVDLSHSSLFVDDFRATSMKNFIKEDGTCQKRGGWREIYQFDKEIINGAIHYNRVNGVWAFKTTIFNVESKSYDVEEHIVAHVGDKLFQFIKTSKLNGNRSFGLTNDTEDYDLSAVLLEVYPKGKSITIEDRKSYGIVQDERLYLFCGTYLMIGYFKVEGEFKFQVRQVENDEYTYIPTTTIAIACEEWNTLAKSDEDTYSVIERHSLDDVNMMNVYRKNTLIGLSHKANEILVGDKGKTQYSFTLDNLAYDFKEQNTSMDIEVIVNGTYYIGEEKHTASNLVLKPSVELSNDTLGFIVKHEEVAYDEGIRYGKTTLIFNYNVEPVIDGEDNIEVIYRRDTNQAQKINDCTFGIKFGVDNRQDRLFVSGNKTFPNMDWHTSQSKKLDSKQNTIADFTYFSDVSYAKYGNTTNEVNGYAILGDGTLAVLKTPSYQEPTIYFRTAKYTAKLDSTGNTLYDLSGNALYEETYPIQVGVIGQGNIGFNTIHNLAGDCMMLGENGIFGIEYGNNVVSTQRYAIRRSRLIDSAINKVSRADVISSASCIVFKDKFYCSIGDTCYVADGRQKCQLEDDLSGEYGYEWYLWNNVPARFFFEFDNKLWFGTDYGNICCFEGVNFKDTTYLLLDESNITTDGDFFVVSKEHIQQIENMSDNDYVSLYNNKTDNIYALCLDGGKDCATPQYTIEKYDAITEGVIYDCLCISLKGLSDNARDITIEKIRLFPLYTLRMDRIDSNNCKEIFPNVDYIVSSIIEDLENDRIYLLIGLANSSFGANRTLGVLHTAPFRVCYKLPEQNSVINVQTDDGVRYDHVVEENGKYFLLDDEGYKIEEYSEKPKFNRFQIRDYSSNKTAHKIVDYCDNKNLALNGLITLNNIVTCYYYTKCFDCGTQKNSKNLKRLIIVPDNWLGTSVDFGYETKKMSKTYNVYTGRSFDFDTLNFDSLNFDNERFASGYAKEVVGVNNWNFIRFFFKNDSDNNCKISNLTFIITTINKNRGIC